MKLKKVLIVLLVVATISMTIGYAAVNGVILSLSGDVTGYNHKNVFIEDIKLLSNSGINLNSTTYSANDTMLASRIEFIDTSSTSEITYQIKIQNISNQNIYYVGEVYDSEDNSLFYTNPNITFKVTGLSPSQIINSSSSVTFTITFKYEQIDSTITSQTLNSYINFKFINQYDIVYENIDNYNYPTTILEESTYSQTFINDVPRTTTIFMDDKQLTLNKDYTYSNGTLVIPNITGNLKITNHKLFNKLIKELYSPNNTNGIYYHDITLENGAKDNSYRYSGLDPNNYVCFGTEDSTCTDDNLYRIIGLFGNNVKIVKYTSIGSYYWNTEEQNINGTIYQNYWYYKHTDGTEYKCTLNKLINGTDYWDKITPVWKEYISFHEWNVDGHKGNDAIPYTHYQAEQNIKCNAYIGLISASEHGFTALPSAWRFTMSNYRNDDIGNINWTSSNRTDYEWTMTRNQDQKYLAYRIRATGGITIYSQVKNYQSPVRPAFYLTDKTRVSSGDGSKINPYRLSL